MTQNHSISESTVGGLWRPFTTRSLPKPVSTQDAAGGQESGAPLCFQCVSLFKQICYVLSLSLSLALSLSLSTSCKAFMTHIGRDFFKDSQDQTWPCASSFHRHQKRALPSVDRKGLQFSEGKQNRKKTIQNHAAYHGSDFQVVVQEAHMPHPLMTRDCPQPVCCICTVFCYH